MLKKLLLAALAAFSVPAFTAAQLPWACSCTRTVDAPFASRAEIGSVAVSSSCTVTTAGASTYCQITGTATFSYSPVPGFTLIQAGYGPPSTTITPPLGTTAYPLSGTWLCNGSSNVASAYVNGSYGGAQIGISARQDYSCSPL